MELSTAIGSLFAAFGLSGAAGLNPWLPLFVSALLARLEIVELDAPFEELPSTAGLVVLGGLTAGDLRGRQDPARRSRPPRRGSSGCSRLRRDAVRWANRLLSCSAPGLRVPSTPRVPLFDRCFRGLGNSVLSLGEDIGSLLLTATAFLLPALALVGVVALAIVLVSAWRRLRRRGGRRA